MTSLVGLYREPECSPGRHRSNDALLLEQIARELRARGASVTLQTFEEAEASRPWAPEGARPSDALVFSMCQGPQALARLLDWERAGLRIVNSTRAARNTYRDRLPRLLASAGVAFPETRLLETAGADAGAPGLDGPHWLKRGDVHASVSADVQRVDTGDDLARGLAGFVDRGISHAALQRHHAGAEIKFYGVAGGAFFHWYFTSVPGTGLPSAGVASARVASNDAASNDVVSTDRVSTDALQALAERAAAAAGLDIFGGDVIVEPSGQLTLIDLNDWPSFAPCRDAASDAIADFLMRRVDAAWNAGFATSAYRRAL